MENVNQEVHEVENHPSGISVTLPSQWLDLPLFAQPTLDGVGDGVNLTVGVSAADQKVVGYCQTLGYIQDDDAFGLLIGGRCDCAVEMLGGLSHPLFQLRQ